MIENALKQKTQTTLKISKLQLIIALYVVCIWQIVFILTSYIVSSL